MAIKKVIEIDVEQVKAMGGLAELQKSLQNTEEKSKSLKQELRELKQRLAELPEGTDEYNKIAKRAGEVSDQIGDINNRIRNLGSDTKNIDAVVQGTETLAGAFSVAQSASALFGDENKDLQETLVKIQASTGLVVGIQSIANALQKESALYIGLSNVATTAQIALQKVFALVVGTSTGALKAFRLAIVSTGVGALVVALGFLIEKLASGTNSTEKYEEAQKNLNDAIDSQNKLLELNSKAIDNKTKLDLLRGKLSGKSENELLEIERKAYVEREKLYANDAKIKFKLFQDAKNNATLKAEDIKKAEDAYMLSNQKWNDAIQSGLEFNLGKEVEYQEEIKKQRQKQAEETKRKAKERADELVRIEKEKYDRLREEAEKFFANAKNIQDAFDKNLEDSIAKLDSLQLPEDIANRQVEASLKEIDLFQGTLSQKQALLEQYNQSVVNNEMLSEEAKDYYRRQGLEREKIINEQKLNLTKDTFGKLAVIFGEQSKAGKAFAVAQALINTYQGITAELATKALTPYEIGLKVVNVAYIAKTGFDSVKKILATNPTSSGGGSSVATGGGGAQSTTPQFNIVGQSSTNQLADTIANKQNQPVQTYVVGNQVTTQQALDRNAVQTATFG